MSFAPPLKPIALQGGRASLHLGYDDVCSLHEDPQTSRQPDYLFDPHPPPLARGVTVLASMSVESAQTREDAVDVLFEPPLERSGDSESAGTVIPKVKICHVRLPKNHPRNVGISRSTHGPQRGHVRGRGPHWRGRGPRDELS